MCVCRVRAQLMVLYNTQSDNEHAFLAFDLNKCIETQGFRPTIFSSYQPRMSIEQYTLYGSFAYVVFIIFGRVYRMWKLSEVCFIRSYSTYSYTLVENCSFFSSWFRIFSKSWNRVKRKRLEFDLTSNSNHQIEFQNWGRFSGGSSSAFFICLVEDYWNFILGIVRAEIEKAFTKKGCNGIFILFHFKMLVYETFCSWIYEIVCYCVNLRQK